MFTGWALLKFDLSCVTLGQGCATNPPTYQNLPNPTQPVGLGRYLGAGGLGWIDIKGLVDWVGL